MSNRVLHYDGGSLQRPDSAAVLADEVEVITFHPSCFEFDGSWRADVIAMMEELINTYKVGLDA